MRLRAVEPSRRIKTAAHDCTAVLQKTANHVAFTSASVLFPVGETALAGIRWRTQDWRPPERCPCPLRYCWSQRFLMQTDLIIFLEGFFTLTLYNG